MKITKCNYCGAECHSTKHINLCAFNPRVNKKILEYLEIVALSDEKLNFNDYDDYARENKLPISSTITSLFKESFLGDATKLQCFIYLIYRSYELGLVNEIEWLDLLVYRQTFGNFGLTTESYFKRMVQIVKKTDAKEADIDQAWDNLISTVLFQENNDGSLSEDF